MKNPKQTVLTVLIMSILTMLSSFVQAKRSLSQGSVSPNGDTTIEALIMTSTEATELICPKSVHKSSLAITAKCAWSYEGYSSGTAFVLTELYPVPTVEEMNQRIALRDGAQPSIVAIAIPKARIVSDGEYEKSLQKETDLREDQFVVDKPTYVDSTTVYGFYDDTATELLPTSDEPEPKLDESLMVSQQEASVTEEPVVVESVTSVQSEEKITFDFLNQLIHQLDNLLAPPVFRGSRTSGPFIVTTANDKPAQTIQEAEVSDDEIAAFFEKIAIKQPKKIISGDTSLPKATSFGFVVPGTLGMVFVGLVSVIGIKLKDSRRRRLQFAESRIIRGARKCKSLTEANASIGPSGKIVEIPLSHGTLRTQTVIPTSRLKVSTPITTPRPEPVTIDIAEEELEKATPLGSTGKPPIVLRKPVSSPFTLVSVGVADAKPTIPTVKVEDSAIKPIGIPGIARVIPRTNRCSATEDSESPSTPVKKRIPRLKRSGAFVPLSVHQAS